MVNLKYKVSLSIISIVILTLAIVAMATNSTSTEKLPVKIPEGLPEGSFFVDKFWKHYDIVGLNDINANAFLDKGNEKGLILNLSKPLNGEIYFGLIPPNSVYEEPYFKREAKIVNGTALLDISKFVKNSWQGYPALDIYGWHNKTTFKGTIYYKMVLHGSNRDYIYYGRVSFKRLENGTFIKIITITEGPIVANVTSDDPSKVIVVFETDRPSKGIVNVIGVGNFTDNNIATRHEIAVKGLKPNTTYKYYVIAIDPSTGENITSRTYWFKTAPEKGSRHSFKWVFTNDGRGATGGEERDVCGVNAYVNSLIFAQALEKNASFVVYTGDLITGYTKRPEDYIMQLKTWRLIAEPANHYIPIYVTMGNHEFLVNAWDDGTFFGVQLDKWPYDTMSSEALFAKEFVNPTNGPKSEDGASYDPDPNVDNFPPYKETAYYFRYGNIMVVVVNTDYWGAIESEVSKYGGNIMGYIMDKQLEWLKKVLDEAEQDPTIDWIFVVGHTPAFPAGGHTVDSMWYKGNNTYRPYIYDYVTGKLVPAPKGIVERRNEFWEILSNHSKVLAYFSGHEHNYYRILITNKTPVGVPEVDDVNGDGVLDKYSPNPKFKYPVWEINVGTAGAEYYAKRNDQYVPWKDEVKAFSIIPGYVLIEVNGKHVELKYYSIYGQLLDKVDLTSIRGVQPPKPTPTTTTMTVTVTATETTTETTTKTVINTATITTTSYATTTSTQTVTQTKTQKETTTITTTVTTTTVSPTTITKEVKVTAWDVTIGVGIVLLIIGIVVTYFAVRRK